MTAKQKGVRTTHKDYDDLLPVWQKCADVEKGQRAIHKGRERYLKKNGGETEQDYEARLCRSDFYNAYFRTISGLVGMAFRKDPAVELPASMESYQANIDLEGRTLFSLAKDACEDVLEYGRIGLLVDHPPMPDNVSAISVAVAERMGLRPSIKTYDAKCIINWRFAKVMNAKVLVRVVLKEEADVSTDEFEEATEDRWRVLDLDENGQYRQRVFRIDSHGKDEEVSLVYPLMNGRPLNYIPFALVGANGMGGDCEEPPLIDLVDANLAHYRLNSDYRHGLHWTALPTMFLAGVEEEEGKPFYIGGSTAITSRLPDAKGMYIEYTGQGLGALETAIKEQEQRMAILGARMIADETRQAETLGATQIKRAGENATMAAIVISVSDAITWALRIMAEWSGAAGDVMFEINREFNPLGLSAQDLAAIFSGVQQGIISEREAFDLLQRGDVIAGEKDFELHQEEIAQEPPMQPPAPGQIAA